MRGDVSDIQVFDGRMQVEKIKEARMSHSLAHHAKPHVNRPPEEWWTVHWTILITLAVVLIAVLFLGVPVAQ